MGQLLGRIPVEALLAVVTVSAGRRMTTLETNAARNAAGQLEQLHVEATAASVAVTVANWRMESKDNSMLTKARDFVSHPGF